MSRWGEQQSCKFVFLYRNTECLWKVTDPGYKKKEMRAATYEYLVNEMNIPNFTVKDVAKKIRSFRSTYNQELAKVRKSKTTSSGTDQVYTPTVKWFEDMDFVIKNSNVAEKPNTLNADTYDENEELFNEDEWSDQPVPEINLVLTSQEGPKKRLGQNISAPAKKLCGQSINTPLSSTVPSVISTAAYIEDECDLIGKHVAVQLRQLPVEKMIDANLEIQNVLAKYRKNLSAALAEAAENQ